MQTTQLTETENYPEQGIAISAKDLEDILENLPAIDLSDHDGYFSEQKELFDICGKYDLFFHIEGEINRGRGYGAADPYATETSGGFSIYNIILWENDHEENDSKEVALKPKQLKAIENHLFEIIEL